MGDEARWIRQAKRLGLYLLIEGKDKFDRTWRIYETTTGHCVGVWDRNRQTGIIRGRRIDEFHPVLEIFRMALDANGAGK